MRAILPQCHRSLALHLELVAKRRSHSITFKESRNVLNRWAEQLWLEEGQNSAWEDLCTADLERWQQKTLQTPNSLSSSSPHVTLIRVGGLSDLASFSDPG
jgi:hypothetical protein